MKKNYFVFLLFIIPLMAYSQPGIHGYDIIISKADSLFDAGDFASCAILYKQADSLLKNSEKESFYCQCKLAETFNRQSKFEESQNIALKVLNACPPKYYSEKAEALNILGLNNLNRGRQDLAEKYFTQAFDLYKDQNNSLAKAKCYDYIGILNWHKGNQEKAQDYLFQALEIRKEMSGANSSTLAASYNNLGLINSNSNPESALEYYNDALEIYKSIYSLNHPNIAFTLNNIGIIQRKLGDLTSSIQTFEKSLAICNVLFGDSHPIIAFIYNNLGECYFENEQNLTALEYHEKALYLYKKIYGDKHPDIASTFNDIGNIYLKESSFKKALSNYQEAICANLSNYQNKDYYSNPRLHEYYNPELLLTSLHLKSKALEAYHYNKTLKLKDLLTAFTTLEICDSLIGTLRQIRSGSKDKIALGKISTDIYEDGITTAYSLSQITLRKKFFLKKAFYFSERNKGSVLLESIAESEAKSFAGIPDSILNFEESLKTDITYLEQKLAQGPDAAEEKVLRKKLFESNNKYESLVSELEKNYPDYYNLKFNNKTVSITELQASLKDDEVLLNYFIAENNKMLFIFLVKKKGFSVYNLTKPDDFDKKLTSFRNAIKLNAKELYTKTGYNLNKLLLPTPLSSKTKELIIIPDGRIGSIPFEALLTQKVKNNNSSTYENFPYLIKKHYITYNYSSLLYYNSRIENNASSKSIPSSILVTAPVNFDPEASLPSLPGTAAEAEKISDLCNEKKVKIKILKEEDANEENIKSNEIKNYEILHFATHGIVNEENPELSEIYLRAPKDHKEDGNLFSGEIYNLKLNANLVVLSACQTGLGKIRKGEGIIGLSRALIYAGAKNLIVSLWTVSDESTSSLMVSFYSLITSNIKNPIALQSSKLNLIKTKEFSAPYYWAPFIYIGQ